MEPIRQTGSTPVPQAEDEELLRATLRLNSTGLALFLGLICGLGLFVATNWLVLKGGPPGADGTPLVGPHLDLLGQYFIGYSVSFVGSLIGFLWAFAVGAGFGLVVGRVYNRIATVDD